ncbi:Myotubularin [Entamoeba marina]
MLRSIFFVAYHYLTEQLTSYSLPIPFLAGTHRGHQLLKPTEKPLLAHFDATLSLANSSLLQQCTTSNGWHIKVSEITDLSNYTDDAYLTWATDRDALRKLIARVASGLYVEHDDISNAPRSLSYTFLANNKRSTVHLEPWTFERRTSRWGVKKDVWIAQKRNGTAGTCHVVAKTERQHELMNVYSTTIMGKHIIRSGAINSVDRLRMFVQVLGNVLGQKIVRSALGRIGRFSKVCSISLVSTSKFAALEKQIALRQHDLLTSEEWKKMGISLVHFNYQFSLNEVLGVSIGEGTSRGMNANGLKELIAWFQSDYPHIEISKNVKAPLQADTTIGKAREKLLRSIISSHSGATSSRVQELLILLLYLHLSDVTICINCKSGCDRTGLVFALATAVGQLIETRCDDVEEIADVVIDYDKICQTTKEDFEKKSTKKQTVEKQEEIWVQCIIDKIPFSMIKGTKERKQLIAIELQNCIFENMIAIGLPITIFSTGVVGFKYGKDSAWFKNPHVNAALPYFILCGNKTYTQVAFRKLLVGASSLRGGSD